MWFRIFVSIQWHRSMHRNILLLFPTADMLSDLSLFHSSEVRLHSSSNKVKYPHWCLNRIYYVSYIADCPLGNKHIISLLCSMFNLISLIWNEVWFEYNMTLIQHIYSTQDKCIPSLTSAIRELKLWDKFWPPCNMLFFLRHLEIEFIFTAASLMSSAWMKIELICCFH